MSQNKKRREISWSPAANATESNSTQEMLDRLHKKQKLISADEEFANTIDIHLDNGLLELLTYQLTRLKQQGKLHALLEYNDYRMFAWALEHRNVYLINYLLQNLSSSSCFVMLQHNDWAAIKAFVKVSKNLEWNDDFDQSVVPILKSILNVQPAWQVKEVIENSLSNESSPSNNNTVERLRSYLNLENKASADNVQASEKSEQGKKMIQEPDLEANSFLLTH